MVYEICLASCIWEPGAMFEVNNSGSSHLAVRCPNGSSFI